MMMVICFNSMDNVNNNEMYDVNNNKINVVIIDIEPQPFVLIETSNIGNDQEKDDGINDYIDNVNYSDTLLHNLVTIYTTQSGNCIYDEDDDEVEW